MLISTYDVVNDINHVYLLLSELTVGI